MSPFGKQLHNWTEYGVAVSGGHPSGNENERVKEADIEETQQVPPILCEVTKAEQKGQDNQKIMRNVDGKRVKTQTQWHLNSFSDYPRVDLDRTFSRPIILERTPSPAWTLYSLIVLSASFATVFLASTNLEALSSL